MDGSHVAAGCVVVYSTMGTTVGPSVFLTGFNSVGLHVSEAIAAHHFVVVTIHRAMRRSFSTRGLRSITGMSHLPKEKRVMVV